MPVPLLHPAARPLGRRGFLAGLGTAGLLTGCGGPSAVEPGVPTRRVVDGTGRSVDVPAEPRRLAVLSALYDMSLVVELGLTPFALFDTRNPTSRMPEALRSVVEGAELLGDDASEVDPEQLADLAPDLVLHNVNYGGLAPEVVQRIAPTITFDFLADDATIADSMRRTAGWFGREAEAEAVITRWDDQLAALADRLDLRGRSFSLVFPLVEDGTFQLLGPESDLGRLVIALGGSVVPAQVGGEALTDYAEGLSFEVLPDLVEADTALVVRYFSEGSDAQMAEFAANPLWQAADVVAAGRVITVDVQDTGSHGYAGLVNAAQTIADGIATAG